MFCLQTKWCSVGFPVWIMERKDAITVDKNYDGGKQGGSDRAV